MASLGDALKLVSFKTGLESLFVTNGISTDSVLVTSNQRHIGVYSIQDQRPLYTWSVKSGQQLGSAAVLNQTTDQFAVVLNKEVIRLWNRDDYAIDKAKKIKPCKPVHAILSAGDWEPVVVFEDGTISWLSRAKESMGEAAVPQGDSIQFVDATRLEEVLYVVIVVKQTVMVYNMEKESASPEIKTFSIEKGGGKEKSHCLHCQNGNLHLITLLSDGRLLQTALSGPDAGNTSTLQQIPRVTDRTGILSLGPTHLAVPGIISQGDKEGVGIWDTKFGILQAWTPLPEECTPNEKIHLFKQEHHLLVACGTGLHLYPVTIKSSTLGSALGKFSQEDETRSQGQVQDAALESLLTSLTANAKPGREKKFKLEVAKLMKQLREQPELVLYVQQPIAHVVNQFLEEKNFWPREELRKLITANLVPPRLCPQLFKALEEHEELTVLHSCLCNMQDIPEAAMVQCLTYFLRTDGNKFSIITDEDMRPVEDIESGEAEFENPFHQTKAALINRILSLPYNDVFLLECLRNLDFKHTLELLQYLHFLLGTMSVIQKDKHEGGPSLLKIVDWICLLLDAHFAQMILAPEARKILVDLHQIVETQVEFYDELVSLEGILSQLKERLALPKKQTQGVYCIQTLHVL